MNQIINGTLDWIKDPETWQSFGGSALRIVAIFLIGRFVIWIVHKSVDRFVINRASKQSPSHARRMTTVGKLMKNVISYIFYFIVIMILLSEVGIDLGPLLAGAGVAGIAIGFGAQSLVKDILTGFFIILEDQFAVGDVIQTGQFKGTVEVIGLRTTKIQSWTGEIHIIPNGMINEVTNFSINNTLAVVDVLIAYEADVDKAMTIIRETVKQLKHEHLVKEPEVLGVQLVAALAVTIRVIAECNPNMHTFVARYLNKEVKDALDQHGIEIPYPKMVTYQRSYEEV